MHNALMNSIWWRFAISRHTSFSTSSTWLSNTARRYLAGQTRWYVEMEMVCLFRISLVKLYLAYQAAGKCPQWL